MTRPPTSIPGFLLTNNSVATTGCLTQRGAQDGRGPPLECFAPRYAEIANPPEKTRVTKPCNGLIRNEWTLLGLVVKR
jgi:hypothetical protein